MQDNAPGHAAKSTIEWLADKGITPIVWPARSPDLNPIEHCWGYMKSYLALKYGDRRLSELELREALLESWNTAVTDERLDVLCQSMKKRCQQVIDAKGGHTRY